MQRHEAVPYFSDNVLSEQNIQPSQIADRIEQLIRDRAEAKVWIAPKASVSLPDGRYAMSTMALANDPPYLALKSLLLNPSNPDRGEPLMNSIIILQDSTTGQPVALLDGNWITAERTAALSLVAARRMAKPDSRVIAFIGCGLQARSHLRALAGSFPLSDVKAFGRGTANINRLHELATDLGLTFQVLSSAKDALQGADIIVSSITRTSKAKPFMDAKDIEIGSFASLVDLGQPWLPASMQQFGCIIIDDREQEARMKDPMVQEQLVSGDLSDLVLGNIDAARGTRPSAFVFRGYAIGDFALATLAHEHAHAQRSP